MNRSIPIVLIGVIVLATAALTARFWEPLQGTSDTVRNIGLVAAGAIAVVLGAWRSTIAQRQAEAAESDSVDKMFQAAAEMLGHREMSVRTSGVIALTNVGTSFPNRYAAITSEILSHFLEERRNTESSNWREVVLDFHGSSLRYKGPADGAEAFSRYYSELQPALTQLHGTRKPVKWRFWRRRNR